MASKRTNFDKQEKRKMKNEEKALKINENEFSKMRYLRRVPCFLASHVKSSTISRVFRCCCQMFDETSTSSMFFLECVISRRKSTTNCGRSPFFRGKVSISTGSEQNTHFTSEKLTKHSSLRSAPLTTTRSHEGSRRNFCPPGVSDRRYFVRESEIRVEESSVFLNSRLLRVPNSILVLALTPSWSHCLLPDSGAVSGWASGASVQIWFLQAGTEDVLENEFILGSAVPVSGPSGSKTDHVCSLSYDLLTLIWCSKTWDLVLADVSVAPPPGIWF